MDSTINVTLEVAQSVAAMTSKGEVFTAYDVTKKVNENGPVARHYNIKGVVHSMYQAGDMGDVSTGYRREMVTLDLGNDDADAWVYYPSDKTAYDHPLAKKQTVQAIDDGTGVPVLDLDSIGIEDEDEDDEDDSVIVSVTEEHRIQIPKKVLSKIDVTKTSTYDILDINGDLHCRFPEKDGRVRITDRTLPTGSKIKVKVDSNIIYISPA